ncbi:OmpA family protein [Dysgonomonas sp. 216]|uniref:OmpA family protein n=1 Tax=Dysgonomonas sp. 216 TaxID=2302934 RepID=UPI0013D59D04|nr:OmpA family protein [Dysgonomonas sp. 216]NDW19805.1 OmpA family protein [Dysgonomonas sp. 216]
MKKVSLLLCLILMGSASIFAQESGVSTEAGRKTTFVRNGFWNNWFLGAGAGASIYVGPENQHADIMDRFTVNPTFMVGKWFNPYLGARLAAQGGSIHTFTGDEGQNMFHHTHLNAHVDFMFNFTNYICKYNEKRFYNFIPTIGVGYERRDKDGKFFRKGFNGITANASLLNTFRISNRLSAYIEVGGYFVEREFNKANVGRMRWNGIATGSAGLILKVGKVGFEEATLMDPALINDLNDQINRLKADNARMAKQLPCKECPKVTPTPTPVAVADVVVPNVVFFRINSANVDKNQEINIYNTAEYMKANPDAKVKIVGYADKQTGTADYNMKLSEKRAKNVAKTLIEKYNINSNRVNVEWKGSSEQPYKENAWNRVAIFFAE